MKIKVVCIKDCGDNKDTFGYCVTNSLYLTDSWIMDRNIPCPYKWDINNEALSCYNIYSIDGKMKGMYVSDNFISLAEFREKRLNSILDDCL